MNTEMRLPHDLETERALLGCILIDPDVLFEVGDRVTPDMFYPRQHQQIYEALKTLHGQQEPIDIITVPAAMNRTEPEVGTYLIELMNAVPTSLHAAAYADIVADKATRRRMIAAGGEIAKGAWNEAQPLTDALALAEAQVMALRRVDTQAILTPRQYTSDYLDEFLAEQESGHGVRRLSTGYADIDRLILGIEPPHQYLIAGRPGMGKSALVLSMVLDAVLKQRRRAMLFSLEMSQKQLMNRLLAMMTGVELARIRQPWELTDGERARVLEANGQLSDAALFLNCQAGLKPSDIRTLAGRVYLEHGLDLVAVDHMHLMRPDTETGNRVLDLGDITMQLAMIYKDLNVIGLTAAQLSRGVEQRAIKRPMLSDLRESGQIEENAYVVMFLYREGYYDPMADQTRAELIVAKNRDGATGTATLFWNAVTAEYKNAAIVELNRANGRTREIVL